MFAPKIESQNLSQKMPPTLHVRTPHFTVLNNIQRAKRMSSAHVLLLCGLPGCGKSSLARELKESSTLFDRVVHIEYDDVAHEIQLQQCTTCNAFNSDSLGAWRSSRNIALDRLDQELGRHFFQEDNTPASRLLIIMDDNFHLRSMRKNVYQICQSHANANMYFCILWLDTPLQVCLDRNRQRPQKSRVPDETILKMSLEVPDPVKASWEQGWVHFTNNSNTISIEQIMENSQVVHPPPPPVDPEILEAERRKTRESLLHTYDGYMRGWVSAVAQMHRSDAGPANKARKDILQKLRNQKDNIASPASVMEWFVGHVCSSSWTSDEIEVLKTAMQTTIDQQ